MTQHKGNYWCNIASAAATAKSDLSVFQVLHRNILFEGRKALNSCFEF